MIDLQPAADEVAHLLDGVTDDLLTAPTPCTDLPVAALLDHLMALSLAFTRTARKAPQPAGAPGPGVGAAERLDPRWRTLLPRRLDEMAAAWRDPAAWEGTSEAGGVTMPAGQLGVVALDELVMHGWDLARATGQPFSCDPVSAEAVLAFTRTAAGPGFAANRVGLFGPVVEVPEDAPALDRALGLAGRDPDWTPGPA